MLSTTCSRNHFALGNRSAKIVVRHLLRHSITKVSDVSVIHKNDDIPTSIHTFAIYITSIVFTHQGNKLVCKYLLYIYVSVWRMLSMIAISQGQA